MGMLEYVVQSIIKSIVYCIMKKKITADVYVHNDIVQFWQTIFKMSVSNLELDDPHKMF